jgi:hypothetical protein
MEVVYDMKVYNIVVAWPMGLLTLYLCFDYQPVYFFPRIIDKEFFFMNVVSYLKNY